MSEACRHALGGCIPVQANQRANPQVNQMACPPVPPPQTLRPQVSLVGDRSLDPAFWPVKYQGPRGTCNAFAVNAAEELYHWRNAPDQPIPPLSEEYLYSAMRQIGFRDPRLNLGLSDKEIAARLRSGATYLAQARLALIDTGVCADTYAPYTVHKPINFYQPSFSEAAHQDAAQRKAQASELQHFIVTPGPERKFFGLDRVWEPPLETDQGEGQSCSDVIHAALMAGTPVVAGFCILTEVGNAAWFGLHAARFGSVAYPSDQLVRESRLAPRGGHAVCIIGYEPGTAPGEGWFLIRNSFGPFGFACDRDMDNLPPRSVARGYGYISEQDVDRYCWEMLFRAAPQDRPTA
jgi:hypothetical protein